MATNETPEAQGEVEGMTSQGAACPVCGKPRNEWSENAGHGIKDDALEYCSQHCVMEGRQTHREAKKNKLREGIEIAPSSGGCV